MIPEELQPLVGALNPAQKEAVIAPPEHRLVLAGAGSGKTRVLTHRVAWLVAREGVSPHSILAVTFTNKAANEMRARIEQLIKVPIRAMWVGTFHGIAHRMLRLHWKEAKLSQNFQILDSDDQIRLVKRVLKQLELPDDKYPPKILAGWISTQKEEGLRPHMLADTGDFTQRQYVRVYTAYHEQCEKSGVVDFSELLLRAYELCRDVPQIQQHYRGRFRHILVDEFQDTNKLQYNWLKVLAGNEGVMFAVGDDDQCLVKGTQVTMADGSSRPIERIRPGDAVLSSFGSGDFRGAPVARVHARRKTTEMVTLIMRSGRRLTSTPEHTHFAGYVLGEAPQTYFCYLMFRRGIGYRLGTSQVYTRSQAKPKVGFKLRSVQEHADALWVISTHASENEARAEEIILSLRYGIPTLPFVPRKGKAVNGLVHDPVFIRRVFAAVDTEAAAQRLLKDVRLNPAEPHHRAQSRNSKRRNLVVTLCSDRRGASTLHRASMIGNDAAGRALLEQLGYPVRRAKAHSKSWRFDLCRADLHELRTHMDRIRKALDAQVICHGRLLKRSLPFVEARSVRPGMAMAAADGGYDIVEKIQWQPRRACTVYDLDVSGTHNFVASGLFTHNSIYSWRGARVENMMKLEKDFPGCEIIRLEQNYRSTGTILKAANGLIARNSGRLGKVLWTDSGDGEQIHLYAAFNEYDEAEFVVNRMKEHLDGRCRHSDLAVLYRMGAQSRVLEEALIRARLPYRIYGGLRFFERMEVKDALAYLRLLHNRDDDVSFERAVNTPARGIGATSIDRLREIARASGVSLWLAAKNAAMQLGRTTGAIQQFQQLIEAMAAEGKGKTLSQLTEIVIQRSGLIEHYKKEKGEQAEGRIENLEELVNAARSFEKPQEEAPLETAELNAGDPLSEFLTHAALESGERQAGPGEDCVQLMTLHAAKGLEFPVVFLVGMENGIFPSARSTDEGNLEEERRLCYVGITRARKRLYMSHAEVRRVHGVERIGMPSQFLKELPPECLAETRPRAAVLRQAYVPRDASRYGGYNRGQGGGTRGGSAGGGGYSGSSPVPRVAPVESSGPGGLKLGQRVSHAKFGEGVILSFDGDGDRTQIEVKFKSAGTKRLMLQYANLQPL